MSRERRRSLLESLLSALAAQKTIVDELLAPDRPPRGEDLHDLRVALRRMSSLARLSRGFPGKDGACRLRRAARNLRRDLSLQRTLEISHLRLRRRFARDPQRRAAARLMADRILPGGHHEQPTAVEHVNRLKARLAKRHAKRVGQLESARWSPHAAENDFILRALFERRLERMRRDLEEIGIPDEATLHGFRIATKDLRYALEFLEGDSLPLKDLRKALKFFQDVAGDAHDRIELVVLVRDAAEKEPAELQKPADQLLPKLEVDATRAVARSRRLAARLLTLLQSTSLELAHLT